MTKIYNVTLTEAQNKAFEYAAVDTAAWVDNVVQNRCRIATEEIVKIVVQNCLDEGIQIPGSSDAMIDLAYERGWIKTAAQRDAEYRAVLEAEQQAAQ